MTKWVRPIVWDWHIVRPSAKLVFRFKFPSRDFHIIASQNAINLPGKIFLNLHFQRFLFIAYSRYLIVCITHCVSMNLDDNSSTFFFFRPVIGNFRTIGSLAIFFQIGQYFTTEYHPRKFLPIDQFLSKQLKISKFTKYISYHKLFPTKLPLCLQGGSLSSNHWSCKPNAAWLKVKQPGRLEVIVFSISVKFSNFSIFTKP